MSTKRFSRKNTEENTKSQNNVSNKKVSEEKIQNNLSAEKTELKVGKFSRNSRKPTASNLSYSDMFSNSQSDDYMMDVVDDDFIEEAEIKEVPKSFAYDKEHFVKSDDKNFESDFYKASSKPPVVLNPETHKHAPWGFKEELNFSENWSEHNCPKCLPNYNFPCLKVSQDGLFFCYKCGFHGNLNITPRLYRETWISIWRKYILSSEDGLPPPDCLSENINGRWAYAWINDSWKRCWHSLCYNTENKVEDAFIFNDELLNWFRPSFTNATPYGLQNIKKDQSIIFVAHMEDIKPLEQSGVTNILCLPPDLNVSIITSNAWKFLTSIEKTVGDKTELTLALRSTPQERSLEEELGRRLNRERCFRVRWRPEDEEVITEEIGPLDVEKNYGLEHLRVMVESAPAFPVAGIYELQDIEDKFDELYNTGLQPGYSTGWPSLDLFYTVKTGQWTLVTGIPGHGKSSWLDGLLVNLATHHGFRIGIFSPENQPIERHFASLTEKKLKKPFSVGPTPRITETEKNRTKRWLNDRFKVILPDEDNGLWTLDAVLDLAKILVYRYGIRGLVIDPWNELDHSQSKASNETSHISESLTKVRRFARLYDVHVWIVAHPTKLEKKANGKYPVATPYDVSGGAHWRNKADNAVSIYRNVGESDEDVSDIYIQKVRFKEVGKVGRTSIRSEKVSGHFIDDIDHAKRENALAKGEYYPSALMRTEERIYDPITTMNFEFDNEF